MKHKYLCLLFFAGVMSVNVFAQPTIKAQRVAGGKSEENLASMYLTQDGGLIAGGYSWSNISGEKTENSRGAIDYWVVKYDRAGNIQWDKTIGGSGYEGLTSLQQTSDGGYILGGSSDSHISGEKNRESQGGR